MHFTEDAVHYAEGPEGQLHKSLFHERAFTLAHLQTTTQSSARFFSAKLLVWSEIIPGNFARRQKPTKCECAVA